MDLDNLVNNYVIEQKNKMKKLIDNFKEIDTDRYYKTVDKCNHKRFSIGGKRNMFGIYSFDIFPEMFESDFSKGRVFNKRPIIFDFRYLYHNDKVKIIEEYIDKIIHKISFVYYYEYKTNIISYLTDFKNQQLILNSITSCKYNHTNRLIEYENCLINNDEISEIITREYNYECNRVNVKESVYFNVNDKFISNTYSIEDDLIIGYMKEFYF